MIIAIHQPQYLSWLGFFNKIMCSDIFVLLDSVQFQKNGFQNRTKIKAQPAWQWLTVPVSFGFPSNIIDVKVSNNSNWQEKHWKTILLNYQKAPFLKQYSAKLEPLFKTHFDDLSELIVKTNEVILELLDIKVKAIKSSTLKAQGSKSDLLIAICKELGADRYLAGAGGREYMEEDKFEKAGIKVFYQDYVHPQYEQQHNEIPFQKNMSIIDLLFNCGSNSRQILQSGYRVP